MQCFFFIFSKQAEGCVLSSLQSQTGSPLQNSSHLFSSESKQRNFPLFLFILFQQPCSLCCVFVAEKCCKVVVDSVVASQQEGCKPTPTPTPIASSAHLLCDTLIRCSQLQTGSSREPELTVQVWQVTVIRNLRGSFEKGAFLSVSRFGCGHLAGYNEA